ncbi:hypothetical protein PG995_010626 [Apiospora arundinis]
MDEFPQATQGSQVSALEDSEDATDTTVPQVIPRQVNGTNRTNGDTAIPRQGPVVYAPIVILNVPVTAPQDIDLSNDPAAYVAQTPTVNGSDMQPSSMMRAPLLATDTPPRPHAPPIVMSRLEWMNRRNSRTALLSNWPHDNHTNGDPSQQARTTLASWQDTQPSDEPYHNLEEIDNLGPHPENNNSITNGSSGSDIVAVAGSSPRSPRQAD